MRHHFKSIGGKALLTAMFLIPFCAAGQVVLNTDIIPKTGTRSMFYSLDSSCFRPGNTGPDMVWDYTDDMLQDTTALYYLKPEHTPYAHCFPQANLAMTADNTNFDYFVFTDSGYYELGGVGYDSESGRVLHTEYKAPELMLKLPLHPGSRYRVSGQRHSEYLSWYHVHSRMETEHFADATGTVYLPCDTVYNAIRKFEKITFSDSISNGVRYVLATKTIEKYQWFAPGIGAPVLSIDKTISVLKEKTDTVYTGMVSCREQYPPAQAYPYPVCIISNPEGLQWLRIDSKNDGKLLIKFSALDNKSKQEHKLKKMRVRIKSGVNEIPIPEFTNQNHPFLLKIELSGTVESEQYLLELEK